MARGKTKAEAESIATSTTLSIIKDLREEIGRLSTRLKASEEESEEIRTRADAAEARASKAEARATQAEYDVVVLGRGMKSCATRIANLTKLLEENGITANPWTPPEGIEAR
jgi:chromosome segregation ATPase